MNDTQILNTPAIYEEICRKSKEIGFTMPSDRYVGTLLKTLTSSKPGARFLELGTGIGLSLAWMLDGMDQDSKLITVDNDAELSQIARDYFGNDKRVQFVCEDASVWIKTYEDKKFDLIFADAWPGKYSEITEVLNLLKVGGFYIVDDMRTQANWPEGHQKYVNGLIAYLENRKDFNITKMNWSTGLVIAVKTENNQ
ncbi:O-methyltransferase [Spongiimicrobium sp. 3-5]|uniref:O-methyltransferase n=1 Tax=Spongiimicrobium sp. 3-5 TaxID=3332596 RepID=UPI003980A166